LDDVFSTIDEAAYWLMLVYGLIVLAVPGWRSLLAALAFGSALFAWPLIARSLGAGISGNPLMAMGGLGAMVLWALGAGFFLLSAAGRVSVLIAEGGRRRAKQQKGAA
jgi:hypothetical protein